MTESTIFNRWGVVAPYFHKGCLNLSINELINDKFVCRTALSTQGLLNRVGPYGFKDSKSRNTLKLHDRLKS